MLPNCVSYLSFLLYLEILVSIVIFIFTASSSTEFFNSEEDYLMRRDRKCQKALVDAKAVGKKRV